jgi:hypothetical protein
MSKEPSLSLERTSSTRKPFGSGLQDTARLQRVFSFISPMPHEQKDTTAPSPTSFEPEVARESTGRRPTTTLRLDRSTTQSISLPSPVLEDVPGESAVLRRATSRPIRITFEPTVLERSITTEVEAPLQNRTRTRASHDRNSWSSQQGHSLELSLHKAATRQPTEIVPSFSPPSRYSTIHPPREETPPLEPPKRGTLTHKFTAERVESPEPPLHTAPTYEPQDTLDTPEPFPRVLSRQSSDTSPSEEERDSEEPFSLLPNERQALLDDVEPNDQDEEEMSDTQITSHPTRLPSYANSAIPGEVLQKASRGLSTEPEQSPLPDSSPSPPSRATTRGRGSVASRSVVGPLQIQSTEEDMGTPTPRIQRSNTTYGALAGELPTDSKSRLPSTLSRRGTSTSPQQNYAEVSATSEVAQPSRSELPIAPPDSVSLTAGNIALSRVVTEPIQPANTPTESESIDDQPLLLLSRKSTVLEVPSPPSPRQLTRRLSDVPTRIPSHYVRSGTMEPVESNLQSRQASMGRETQLEHEQMLPLEPTSLSTSSSNSIKDLSPQSRRSTMPRVLTLYPNADTPDAFDREELETPSAMPLIDNVLDINPVSRESTFPEMMSVPSDSGSQQSVIRPLLSKLRRSTISRTATVATGLDTLASEPAEHAGSRKHTFDRVPTRVEFAVPVTQTRQASVVTEASLQDTGSEPSSEYSNDAEPQSRHISRMPIQSSGIKPPSRQPSIGQSRRASVMEKRSPQSTGSEPPSESDEAVQPRSQQLSRAPAQISQVKVLSRQTTVGQSRQASVVEGTSTGSDPSSEHDNVADPRSQQISRAPTQFSQVEVPSSQRTAGQSRHASVVSTGSRPSSEDEVIAAPRSRQISRKPTQPLRVKAPSRQQTVGQSQQPSFRSTEVLQSPHAEDMSRHGELSRQSTQHSIKREDTYVLGTEKLATPRTSIGGEKVNVRETLLDPEATLDPPEHPVVQSDSRHPSLLDEPLAAYDIYNALPGPDIATPERRTTLSQPDSKLALDTPAVSGAANPLEEQEPRTRADDVVDNGVALRAQTMTPPMSGQSQPSDSVLPHQGTEAGPKEPSTPDKRKTSVNSADDDHPSTALAARPAQPQRSRNVSVAPGIEVALPVARKDPEPTVPVDRPRNNGQNYPPDQQHPPAPPYPARETPSWTKPDTSAPPLRPYVEAEPKKRGFFDWSVKPKEHPRPVQRSTTEPRLPIRQSSSPHQEKGVAPFRFAAPGLPPGGTLQRPRDYVNQPQREPLHPAYSDDRRQGIVVARKYKEAAPIFAPKDDYYPRLAPVASDRRSDYRKSQPALVRSKSHSPGAAQKDYQPSPRRALPQSDYDSPRNTDVQARARTRSEAPSGNDARQQPIRSQAQAPVRSQPQSQQVSRDREKSPDESQAHVPSRWPQTHEEPTRPGPVPRGEDLPSLAQTNSRRNTEERIRSDRAVAQRAQEQEQERSGERKASTADPRHTKKQAELDPEDVFEGFTSEQTSRSKDDPTRHGIDAIAVRPFPESSKASGLSGEDARRPSTEPAYSPRSRKSSAQVRDRGQSPKPKPGDSSPPTRAPTRKRTARAGSEATERTQNSSTTTPRSPSIPFEDGKAQIRPSVARSTTGHPPPSRKPSAPPRTPSNVREQRVPSRRGTSEASAPVPQAKGSGAKPQEGIEAPVSQRDKEPPSVTNTGSEQRPAAGASPTQPMTDIEGLQGPGTKEKPGMDRMDSVLGPRSPGKRSMSFFRTVEEPKPVKAPEVVQPTKKPIEFRPVVKEQPKAQPPVAKVGVKPQQGNTGLKSLKERWGWGWGR